MLLTYYDQRFGRQRVKRRFVWAFGAFALGLLIGVLLAHAF
ncbi:MAG: hypothetical protein JWR07_4073 [Nevskia sp.]|nr:hypothetical protein [Nevskia sp.]